MRSVEKAGMRKVWVWALGVAAIAAVASGCSLDGLLNTDKVPTNTADPALTKTSKGALSVYQGTVALFRQAFGGDQRSFGGSSSSFGLSFLVQSGLLADEFTATKSANSFGEQVADQRNLPQGGFQFTDVTGGGAYYSLDVSTYSALQRVRAQAGQAIGLLTDYADPKLPALVGHAYTLEAYAEVFLNELYCSGVPLSTLDYNGNYTVKPGSTTEEIFRHAVALFDTALGMVSDSAQFQYLAAVGKGRALLGLGDFAGAGVAVAVVPDGWRYQASYAASDSSRNFAYSSGTSASGAPAVGDHEGSNGIDYISAGDPRAPTEFYPVNGLNPSFYGPATSLYALDGGSPITLASGVEARLIQAEAALQAGDPSWLTILNALRTDGTYDTTATSPPDTLWRAGSGGVAGLGPLTDPGTLAGQVDLLFQERALWLFLTGHRQGDLRRLIRQYGRSEAQVYPAGSYTTGRQTGYNVYGADVTFPLPPDELKINPLVSGCVSRDA